MPSLPFSVSATGNTELLPAPGARELYRILGGELSAVSAQSLVELKSGSGAIWSTLGLNAANSHLELNVDPVRDLITNPGEALNITPAAAGNVRGTIVYVKLGPPTT